MHEMTAINLKDAFGGESMAHMRYKIWSAKAEQEGYPNVARLFAAIAYAEQVHASNHFKVLKDSGGEFRVGSGGGFGLGTTVENLQGGIDGENFEVNEMYAAYLAVAREQGEKAAERSFHYAISAEKIHAAMYQEARQAVESGRDFEIGTIHICDCCGYTCSGELPDKCPICGVGGKQFTSFA